MTALVLFGLLLSAVALADARFLRPGDVENLPVWGVREGLRFAIWPAAVEGPGEGGPRGLIRVGYPARPEGTVMLVNFIAVEPIVEGQTWRSFSELEASGSDGEAGKLIEAGPPPGVEWAPSADEPVYPGRLEGLPGGHARLSVRLRVERFESGARVFLLASVRTDRPDELELQAFTEEGSAPLAACVLTATMGNFARLRQLHLRDRVVTAQELYPGFSGADFAPHRRFRLAELPRATDGSVLVAATTDEADPAAVQPHPELPWFWHYGGRKLTQYWRKPAGTFGDALTAVVNARAEYWASTWPIPGGVAFENFELNEPFGAGQTSIFGLTTRTPEELLGSH